MNDLVLRKQNNVIHIKNKRNKIKKQRQLLLASLIIIFSLFIIGTLVKNMYVSSQCSNLIYSLDYNFTHWNDKDLRLINVESFSVLSKIDNTIEIEATGYGYKKPYNTTTLIGTFTQNSKGKWVMTSVIDKNDPVIEDEN